MNTITFTLKNLHDKAPYRKPGYVEEVLSLATKSGDILTLSLKDFKYIKETFIPKPARLSTRRSVNSRPLPLRPGNLFSLVIFKITSQRASTCGRCAQHIRDMNKWGWFGCWRNRKTIVTWLTEEARRRGHEIDQDTTLNLLKLAFKELRQKPVIPQTLNGKHPAMKEENKVQTIRVIEVSNGFVIVGPKSYIADGEDGARECLNRAFADVLEEFKKPQEPEQPKNDEEKEPSRIIPATLVPARK